MSHFPNTSRQQYVSKLDRDPAKSKISKLSLYILSSNFG